MRLVARMIGNILIMVSGSLLYTAVTTVEDQSVTSIMILVVTLTVFSSMAIDKYTKR